jgi:hypothetical protein
MIKYKDLKKNDWFSLTDLEIIRLIRTRIGEISMTIGDYYYLIQKLEELKNETKNNNFKNK